MTYTLILQRNSFWYISKKQYPINKETGNLNRVKKIIADYPDYMTSIPFDLNGLIVFIKQEWGLSEKEIEIFKKFDKDDSVERIILKRDGWQFEQNSEKSTKTKNFN